MSNFFEPSRDLLRNIISKESNDAERKWVLDLVASAWAYGIAPFLPATLLLSIVHVTTRMRVSFTVLSARLWSIIVGVIILIASNHGLIWLEAYLSDFPGP